MRFVFCGHTTLWLYLTDLSAPSICKLPRGTDRLPELVRWALGWADVGLQGWHAVSSCLHTQGIQQVYN